LSQVADERKRSIIGEHVPEQQRMDASNVLGLVDRRVC
jgi:hypothetical protein